MRFQIALIFSVAGMVMIGCGGNNQTEGTSTVRPPVTVRTVAAEQMDFPVMVRIGGTLVGEKQTVIPAKVTTTVTRVPARVGQKVRAGDLLVMLDPGGVQSQYNQAKAVFLNAEKQLTKMRNLFEAGAISETQFDAVETEYEIVKANFNAARRAIEIEAPFDGVVTDVFVRTGDEVSPGMPIVEVADVSSLRLLLEASAAQVAQLEVGQPVTVASGIDSSVVMTGNVYSIADAADRATRSFEVECRFPSPAKYFAPGMYVNAEIETEVLSAAIVVPGEAILYRSGKAMLYAIVDDTAALITVSELATGNGLSAVRGDIAAGQRIVVVGHKNLTPGASVQEAGQ